MNQKTTKTIVEICDELLNEEERKVLVNDIVVKGGVAVATAYAYINGKRTPMFLYKKMIQKTLKDKFDINAEIRTLFPNI